MAKYYDPSQGTIVNIQNPEWNQDLIKNMVPVPESTPTGITGIDYTNTASKLNPEKTNVITPSSLQPVTPINVPPAPADKTNYAAMLAGDAATLKAINEANAPKTAGAEPDWLTKFLSTYETKPPESLSSLYAQEASNVGLETKGAAVTESQKQLDLLNAEMAGITADAQAQNLALEKQISGGGTLTAGSGDFLNKQQQEVNRQAAIKSLPVQVKILMAQAKLTANQNYLKLAQDKLDTMFKIKSQDIENTYNYNKDLRDKIWGYLTEKEKQKLTLMQKADDRKYKQEKTNLAKINDWQKTSVANGQSELVTEFASLDPKDPDFDRKFGAIQAKVTQKSEWGEPYMLGGDYVQKNVKTGEIRTAVNVPTPTKNVFQDTQTILQQYKDQGYNRQEVEDEWKKQNVASGQDPATVELPLTVQKALDNIYGIATPTPPAKTFHWYNPFTWF